MLPSFDFPVAKGRASTGISVQLAFSLGKWECLRKNLGFLCGKKQMKNAIFTMEKLSREVKNKMSFPISSLNALKQPSEFSSSLWISCVILPVAPESWLSGKN